MKMTAIDNLSVSVCAARFFYWFILFELTIYGPNSFAITRSSFEVLNIWKFVTPIQSNVAWIRQFQIVTITWIFVWPWINIGDESESGKRVHFERLTLVFFHLTIRRNAWNIWWGGRTKYIFIHFMLMIWAKAWQTVWPEQIHSNIVLVQNLELWMAVTQTREV